MAKKILVTTDFSKESTAAFGPAAEYARMLGGAEIILLAVLEDFFPTSVQFEYSLALIDVESILSDAETRGNEWMKEQIAQYFPGLTVTPVISRAHRSIVEEIVQRATSDGVEMVVMATHGRRGLRHTVLGSVTERVVRESKRPVLVVPLSSMSAPAGSAEQEHKTEA